MSAPPEFAQELQFLRALWELDHALESASRRMKSTVGVTGRERLVIRIVGERPGITPGELAEVLHVHPSTVTVMLRRIERRKLVARAADASDGRSSRLSLTRAGRRIDGLRAGTIEAAVKAALSTVDPERVAKTQRLLVSVARRLLARRALQAASDPHRFPPRGGRHEDHDEARGAARRRRSGGGVRRLRDER
ncbi:MAG TPA: MarR family transcriptional regulator [Anaeromyxobacteraceae bacterium]|nr:MarR family transcriptional regulator [Anaeromyxobacteraceae bacterium]